MSSDKGGAQYGLQHATSLIDSATLIYDMLYHCLMMNFNMLNEPLGVHVKFFNLLLLLGFLLFWQEAAHAETNCVTTTEFFIVEAVRKSDPKYSNLLMIKFKDLNGNNIMCGGAEYAYIKNDEPSYSSILSFVLWASSTDKSVTIKIDESDRIGVAARLEYIYPN